MKNFIATVRVHKKRTVADPEGKTIGEALNRIGYNNVNNIRTGRIFEAHITAIDAENAKEFVEKISRDVLSNPIIEVFEFDIKEMS